MDFFLLGLHFIAAAMVAFMANWFGLIPFRKEAQAHWSEKARVLWPARATAVQGNYLLPVILFFIHARFRSAPVAVHCADGLSAYCGSLIGGRSISRLLYPEESFCDWLMLAAAGMLMTSVLWGSFLVAIFAIPIDFEFTTFAVASVVFAIHCGMSLGGWRTLLLLFDLIREPTDRLAHIVKETSARTRIPVRKIWLLKSSAASAYADPIFKHLVFSSRLLEICTDEEVSAVCGHEMGHLTEMQGAIWGRFILSHAFFPIVFIRPAFHSFSIWGASVIFLLVFGITQLRRNISRRHEKRADRVAVEFQPGDLIYAQALEKLYRDNLIPAVGRGKDSSHPHLYDRLVAAGMIPDFPRPDPPLSMTPVGGLYLLAAILLGFQFLYHQGDDHTAPPEPAVYAQMGIKGKSPFRMAEVSDIPIHRFRTVP